MSSPPGTARLFVGLPLPPTATSRLAAIQPPPGDGVRLIAQTDMHVTLHFLGTAELARVSAALAGVGAPGFRIRLGRSGHFALKGLKTILWVGVEPTPALSLLHETTARALEAIGFVPERRPYRPHVTLARLGPGAPSRLVEAFERAAPADPAAGIACARFALFESQTRSDGARYRVVESFPLEASPDSR